jgi:hypothetical protein
VVSWWVVDAHAGGPLEAGLDDAVPRWLHEVWDFGRFVVDPPPPPQLAKQDQPDSGPGDTPRTPRSKP